MAEYIEIVSVFSAAFAVAFGALVLDESLSPNFWLALGAILTGLAISQYRRR